MAKFSILVLPLIVAICVAYNALKKKMGNDQILDFTSTTKEGCVYKRTEVGVYKLLNSISKKRSPRFRSRMVSL